MISEQPLSARGFRPQLPFDRPSAVQFVNARTQFLARFLSTWPGQPFKTVLDSGTGVGYFAEYLTRNYNLKVVGLDARVSNVEEAQRRNPEVEFRVGDVESAEFEKHGQFDLVLALGLIYHLENPFRAIRNLVAASRDAIVVESFIAPGRRPKAWLLDEFPGDDQALANVAWHLTEAAIAKLLYCSGIPHVYRARFKPQHPEFYGRLLRRPTRAFLIGTRTTLAPEDYRRIPEPRLFLDRAYHFRWPLRDLLGRALAWKRSMSVKRVA
jgi:SAM-dependent methyltransferase